MNRNKLNPSPRTEVPIIRTILEPNLSVPFPIKGDKKVIVSIPIVTDAARVPRDHSKLDNHESKYRTYAYAISPNPVSKQYQHTPTIYQP